VGVLERCLRLGTQLGSITFVLALAMLFLAINSPASVGGPPVSLGAGTLVGHRGVAGGDEFTGTDSVTFTPAVIQPGDPVQIHINTKLETWHVDPNNPCSGGGTSGPPTTATGGTQPLDLVVPPNNAYQDPISPSDVFQMSGLTTTHGAAAFCAGSRYYNSETWDLTLNVPGSDTAALVAGCYQSPGPESGLIVQTGTTLTGSIGTLQVGSASCGQLTTLEFREASVPSNDPGRFDLYIDSTLEKAAAGSGDTTGAVPLSPGNHSVTELSALGTDGRATDLSAYAISITCVGSLAGGTIVSGSGPGPLTVGVADGDHVVCTVTNTAATATLVIRENRIGGSATQVFSFNGVLATALPGGSSASVHVPANVPLSESQLVPVGWILTRIVCDSRSISVDVAHTTLSGSIPDHTTVTCVFTDVSDPIQLQGSFTFGVPMKGPGAVFAGADEMVVSGPVQQLGGVQKICETWTWSATKKGGDSTEAFDWGGLASAPQVGQAYRDWGIQPLSITGTPPNVQTQQVVSHVVSRCSLPGQTTFVVVPTRTSTDQFGQLLLDQPFLVTVGLGGGTLTDVDHTVTFTVTFGNGANYNVVVVKNRLLSRLGQLRGSTKVTIG
jgi:hypothetical protein